MAENQEFDKAEREALYKLLPKIGADRDGDIIRTIILNHRNNWGEI